jgi:hypothetical protein
VNFLSFLDLIKLNGKSMEDINYIQPVSKLRIHDSELKCLKGELFDNSKWCTIVGSIPAEVQTLTASEFSGINQNICLHYCLLLK